MDNKISLRLPMEMIDAIDHFRNGSYLSRQEFIKFCLSKHLEAMQKMESDFNTSVIAKLKNDISALTRENLLLRLDVENSNK